MSKSANVQPGEILLEEFLLSMNISACHLANDTCIPEPDISEIINGNRRITADIALKFSKFFETSAQFWLELQTDYDLEAANPVKTTMARVNAHKNQ